MTPPTIPANLARASQTDLVVLGGGLAGLSAGAAAAEAGLQVRIIEKAPDIGGSTALSAGMFWTAPSPEALRRRIPNGDRQLGEKIVQDYDGVLARIRATGIAIAEKPQFGIMTYGKGYSLDIKALLLLLTDQIRSAGGTLSTATTVSDLSREPDGSFLIHAEGEDGRETISTSALVLATGGFQGSRAKLKESLSPSAGNILHRSNPTSSGDGLDLALKLGGAKAGNFSTFYGHLMPSPLLDLAPENFLPYSQYYSVKCILVNLQGDRFADETLGDEILNQDLANQPEARGILIFDQGVRDKEATAEPFPGLGLLDRYRAGVDAGARHAEAETLDGLIAQAGTFGIDPKRLKVTVDDYIHTLTAGRGSSRGVPVSPDASIPRRGPYYAIEVQPAITFTFGGIRIDDHARVLDEAGIRIPGLFAAGADIGGLSDYGYAGGLAPAAITGHWAGVSAVRQSTKKSQ